MTRKWTIPCVILAVLTLAASLAGSLAVVDAGVLPPELVLWNKLGSDYEVLHSEVGQNGTVVGTSHAYEPAQHGNGYVRKAVGQNYVRFPASVLDSLTYSGTIELWINPKVPAPVPYAYGIFGFLGAPYGHYGVPSQCSVCLVWGDTVTGRGFQGGVGFGGSRANTPPEPTQFVATVGVPVHAAISWDIDGIAGTSDTLRVYRDGIVVGSSTDPWNPSGTEKHDIILGYGPDGGGFDKFIVDNIQIWNCAKTDFSGRFVESPEVPSMHVDRITGRHVLTRKGIRLRADVYVVDEGGTPLEGVLVEAVITAPGKAPLTKYATTNAAGKARFTALSRERGWWQVEVTDLSKEGYLYEPGADTGNPWRRRF